jgi:hypothetical protein
MNANIRKQLNDLFVYNTLNINKYDLKHTQMIDMSHFGFLVFRILELANIKSQDRVLLERLLTLIHSNLYTFELVQYYTCFHNIPKKVYSKNDYLLTFDISHANLLIDIFRLRIFLNAVDGSSEDYYFFDRGLHGLLRGIINLKKHFKTSKNLSGAYYALLNYAQTIVEYKRGFIEIESIHLEPIVKEIDKAIMLYKPLLSTIFIDNVRLQCFEMYVCDLMNTEFGSRYPIHFEIFESMISKRLTLSNIWIFNNLIDKNPNYTQLFNDQFEKNSNYEFGNNRDRATLIIDYIKANPNTEFDIMIPPFERSIGRNWFNLNDYFKGYTLSSGISITNEDRKNSVEMNDQQLRIAVSQLIINIDEHKIRREASKPHGSHEIADMELQFLKNDDLYYLCMPFKSGIEIKGKVNVDVIYQIVRPFILLGDSAIVVAVSPREGTESFYNEIKLMNTNPLFKIETLMGDTLVKLLKYNGVI